jgi:hypothetical protein
VKDGVNGFLVPMGEYGTLRDYVELLVRDCTCRTTMGESSRQIALAFDASRIVPRIVAAYNW